MTLAPASNLGSYEIWSALAQVGWERSTRRAVHAVAARLQKGPLPLDQSLRIAIEISDAEVSPAQI
jgi:hypothetical protein